MIGIVMGIDVLIAALAYICYAVLIIRENYYKIKSNSGLEYRNIRRQNERWTKRVCIIIIICGIVLLLGIFFAY